LDQAKAADERAAGMAKVEGLLQKQIIMLRTFCGDLRPPTLAPFGLEKAIQSHADHFQNLHPNIQLRLELMHDGLTIPEKVRLALYRIYQELLNNIVRHAEASIIFIRLRLSDDQIALEVEDNGRGFMVPKRWVEVARQGHLGLVGATERAESVGGTLSIQSTPGKGTVVQVYVPRSFQDDMWSMENLINESVEK
jgi:signal transduction histidine kinase